MFVSSLKGTKMENKNCTLKISRENLHASFAGYAERLNRDAFALNSFIPRQ